jgi:methionyl-tRNA synthetase
LSRSRPEGPAPGDGTFYVTTPIYYANAEPHIGHTYTTVVADTLVRWHRLLGDDVFSVSGTDEHGEKMVEAAAARGLEPAAFTAELSASFQRAWRELGIAPSRFVRTTDPAHVRNVQAILQRVHDEGWIEAREYEGLYCVGCERFLTERDLEGGLCRDHERAPEPRRETNYFFLMSRLFPRLRELLEDEERGFLRPERYRNEALAMLRDEGGLGDLSISRPKSRLAWGIELPFDRDHVCYVWFDALISYLTGAGYPDDPRFAARWAGAVHLIGKDILKPHAIFWPTMLWAMGLAPPRAIRVHGYWQVDDRKVSKSLGNMVSPLAMRDRYGFEAFRYFLLREMSFGLDAAFSEEALVERVNADLANNVGNLVSRTLNLVERFCEGRVPAPGTLLPFAELAGRLGAIADPTRVPIQRVEEAMESLQPHVALAAIVEYASEVNRFLDAAAPWKRAQEPGRRPEADAALYHACQALRALALLLAPFLPATARGIAERLGVPELVDRARLPDDAQAWGRLAPGTPVAKGAPLFPRLELQAAE